MSTMLWDFVRNSHEQAQFSPEGKAESLRSTVGTLAEK